MKVIIKKLFFFCLIMGASLLGALPLYGMALVPQVKPVPCEKNTFVIEVPDEASVKEQKQEYSRGLKEIVINIFGSEEVKKKRAEERVKKEKQKKFEQEVETKARILRNSLGLHERHERDIKNELLRKYAETENQTVKDENKERIEKRERRSKIDSQELVITIDALKRRGNEDQREKEELVKIMEAHEKGDTCKNVTLGCSLMTTGIIGAMFVFTLSFQVYNYFDGNSSTCNKGF